MPRSVHRSIRYQRLVGPVLSIVRLLLDCFSYGLLGFLAGAGLSALEAAQPDHPQFNMVLAAGTLGAILTFWFPLWRSGSSVLAAWKRAWWRWRVYPQIRLDLGRHEAGHALLGRALGLPYTAIVLSATQEGDSGVAVLQPVRVAANDMGDIALRMILALVGGKAAEQAQHLHGPGGMFNRTDDLVKADQLDLLMVHAGQVSVVTAALAAVKDLFREPRWCAALDSVAAIAVLRDVTTAELDQAISDNSLAEGLADLVVNLRAAASRPARAAEHKSLEAVAC